jgi:indole-3-glycerol phosphate synthase
MTPIFIAEIKTRSPFGFESKHPYAKLRDIAIQHGDMVAAHVDPRWGGDNEKLRQVSDLAHKNGKLCLAKGIHRRDIDILNSLYHGADLVLVVGRQPPRELAPVCIWEPTNLDEIATAKDPAQKIMWNERDLSTGLLRRDADFTMARWAHKGWMAQASFIAKPEDVHPKSDAFIVGENLISFVEAL